MREVERDSPSPALLCNLSPLSFSFSPHAFLWISLHPPSLKYYFLVNMRSIPMYWHSLKHAVSDVDLTAHCTYLNELLCNISPSNLLCCAAKHINRSSHAISAGLFFNKLNSRLGHMIHGHGNVLYVVDGNLAACLGEYMGMSGCGFNHTGEKKDDVTIYFKGFLYNNSFERAHVFLNNREVKCKNNT